jgi:hypothetical protein
LVDALGVLEDLGGVLTPARNHHEVHVVGGQGRGPRDAVLVVMFFDYRGSSV